MPGTVRPRIGRSVARRPPRLATRFADCIANRERRGAVSGAGGREHRFYMPGDLDLAPDLGDPSLFVDQKRRALDPHILAPVHALLDPDAVGFGDLVIG